MFGFITIPVFTSGSSKSSYIASTLVFEEIFLFNIFVSNVFDSTEESSDKKHEHITTINKKETP